MLAAKSVHTGDSISPKVQYNAVPPMLRKTVAMHNRTSKMQEPPATSSVNTRAEKVKRMIYKTTYMKKSKIGFYHEWVRR